MPSSSAHRNSSQLSRDVTVNPNPCLAGAESHSEIGPQESLKLVLVGWTNTKSPNRLIA